MHPIIRGMGYWKARNNKQESHHTNWVAMQSHSLPERRAQMETAAGSSFENRPTSMRGVNLISEWLLQWLWKSGEGVLGDHRFRKGPNGIPLEEFFRKTKDIEVRRWANPTQQHFFVAPVPTAPLLRNAEGNLGAGGHNTVTCPPTQAPPVILRN